MSAARNDDAEGIRLAKRVAAMAGCSRREAELLIEQGAVRVDGQLVETPQHRVRPQQQVDIESGAQPTAVVPVTLLLHKPVGVAFDAAPGKLLVPAQHSESDRSQRPPLQRHFVGQHCFTPLETGASGLLVFTQEPRIERKLVEDAGLIENEVMVDVAGPVGPEALRQLNQSPVVDGRAMLPAKVSVGRLPLAGLAPGEWRYLAPNERI